MTKAPILAATLVVVVLAVVGWQATTEGGSAAPAREKAAAQTQRANPESEAERANDGSAVSAPEDPAEATRTERLAVENILQVGGFGCASCQAVVEGILQESDCVEEATYEPETDTYLVKVNDAFRMDEAAERIRSISKEYNRRLGLPHSPAWVLKEA